ncbi:MAG: cold shock protein CspC [Anaerolineae bacterium]
MNNGNRRFNGIVKDYDDLRGCGIIELETGEQVSVRYSAISGQGIRHLKRGEKVSCMLERGARGAQAVQVMRK